MGERKIDTAQLNAYLDVIDQVTQTTRRASEDFHDCPPLEVVVPGERQARTLIDNTYAGFVQDKADYNDVGYDRDDFAASVKASYWNSVNRAKEKAIAFGAADFDTIDDYFGVDKNRYEGAIRAAIREKYTEGSPAIYLLDGIEAYSEGLGADVMTSARVMITHLQAALPRMKQRAATLIELGLTDTDAARETFRELVVDWVPQHIVKTKELVASGRSVTSLINKPSFYGDVTQQSEGVSPPLRLTMDDAKGVMAVYPLEKMAYSKVELELGDSIAQDDRLQSALLLFQLAAIDHTKQYLIRHPERLQHKAHLLPFTEFFVVEDNNDEIDTALVPNPKLIQVMSNNLIPAIAGVMLREGVSLDTITLEQLALAAQEAKKRRVFQLQIGKFNGYDAVTDTLELDAVLNRTCPAMQTMTVGLEQWLPKIYEHCREQITR